MKIFPRESLVHYKEPGRIYINIKIQVANSYSINIFGIILGNLRSLILNIFKSLFKKLVSS